MDRLDLFSPAGNLGYGVQEDTLNKARREYDIDVIGIDGGSTDQGPNYLGQGKPLVSDPIVKRDLRLLLKAQDEDEIPLLISTAGGSGSREHVDLTMKIINDVADDLGLDITVAKIYTDVPDEFLKQNLDKLTVLDFDTEVNAEVVDKAEKIVAQIGPEPYIDALEQGVDVILAGRSLDVSPFAAVPIARGFDKGLAGHLGKILECGALATKPGTTTDGIIGRITDDYFELIYPKEDRRVTTESVASHSLYEKANPNVIHLPDGVIDISDCDFDRRDERRVRISGSKFEPSDKYAVALEGVEKKGYRSITPAGMRSPELITNLDRIRDNVRREVVDNVDYDSDEFQITFRTYGEDAVPIMETIEEPDTPPIEVGIIIDVVGETQEIANAVCSRARYTMLHYGFEERKSTAGNLAFPYSPSDIEVGSVYGFSIHHLLEDVDPLEFTTITFEEL